MSIKKHTTAAQRPIPAPTSPPHGRRQFLVHFTLVLLLAGLAVFSLQLGNYHVSAERTWELVTSWHRGTTESQTTDYSDVVILKLRLPRIIMVLLVGSTLGMAGCVSQGLFRNPLVSPFILGISAGASFGAAFAIVYLSSCCKVLSTLRRSGTLPRSENLIVLEEPTSKLPMQ